MTKTILIVGTAQGIGLALTERYLADGWRVFAGTLARTAELETLAGRYPDRLSIHLLDITDPAAAETLFQDLQGETLDVLQIVAGILPPETGPVWDLDDALILRTLKTNAFSGVRLATRFQSLVRPGGCFAFTSSGMGSMERNTLGGADLYRISKAALNMLVRSFAVTTAGPERAVLLICPGWVKTEMGGANAIVEIADSVSGIYRLVVNARPGNGAPFREYSGDTVPW